MRWVFSFLMVFFIFNLVSQEYKEVSVPVDSATKRITYSKIIELTEVNKDTLYNRGKRWFFSYFKNPYGVIREENKNEYKIMGKHQIKILNPPDKKGIQSMRGIVQYTIITQFKEKKARIILTDFNLKETSYFPLERWLDKSSVYYSNKNYYYFEQINKEMNSIINNFEQFMKKDNPVKSDNW